MSAFITSKFEKAVCMLINFFFAFFHIYLLSLLNDNATAIRCKYIYKKILYPQNVSIRSLMMFMDVGLAKT